MKRITVFLLILLFSLSIVLPAFGESNKIVDNAGLLYEDEVQQLEEKARQIASMYDMDVVILTVHSTNGVPIRDFADDYYDYNGYGIGSDYSGVLFMLAMDTREWYISTCGEGIYAVTDFGIQTLFSGIANFLANNDYYNAFNHYLDSLARYYQEYSQGSPVDGDAPEYEGPGSYEPGDYDDIIYYEPEKRSTGSIIFTSLLIGLAVGGIALLIMRSGMKTVRRQSGADTYRAQSIDMTRQHDHFLYSRTSRILRSDNNSSSSSFGGRSGGGGGSRIHRSSSGRSHGGGGGRF